MSRHISGSTYLIETSLFDEVDDRPFFMRFDINMHVIAGGVDQGIPGGAK